MESNIKLPDLGDGIESGTIVQIVIEKNALINKGDTLIEVETDKAVIPVPSEVSGVIKEIKVQENQEIKAGDIIAIAILKEDDTKKTSNQDDANKKETKKAIKKSDKKSPNQAAATLSTTSTANIVDNTNSTNSFANTPASPATRKLAREMNIDISNVVGTGRKGRIQFSDITNYLKSMAGGSSANASTVAKPLPDFNVFGEVERKPISNLRKTISKQMSYCWTNIPHVHQFQEVDITQITRFQQQHASVFKAKGSTLSVTPFVIKALAECLVDFPTFNTSLDDQKSELIYKKYINIGVAVDTPSGLIVPVLKSVDKMSIFEIGLNLIDLAKATRERKVNPNDLKGASTTLSNLGGIGGSHFTPIINWPEVSILGIGRGTIKPKFIGAKGATTATMNDWTPITTLPVVLAYDHRVIDGAEAARFIMRFTQLIEEPDLMLMGMPQ